MNHRTGPTFIGITRGNNPRPSTEKDNTKRIGRRDGAKVTRSNFFVKVRPAEPPAYAFMLQTSINERAESTEVRGVWSWRNVQSSSSEWRARRADREPAVLDVVLLSPSSRMMRLLENPFHFTAYYFVPEIVWR